MELELSSITYLAILKVETRLPVDGGTETMGGERSRECSYEMVEVLVQELTGMATWV